MRLLCVNREIRNLCAGLFWMRLTPTSAHRLQSWHCSYGGDDGLRCHPKDVRFVATSATIAGDDAAEQLKQFLSDLSGVPTSQIDVWGGRRVIPKLASCKQTPVTLQQLESMPAVNHDEPEVHPDRYEALVHSPLARALRHLLVNAVKPLKLSELVSYLSRDHGQSITQDEILRWLDLCSGTRPNESDPAF